MKKLEFKNLCKNKKSLKEKIRNAFLSAVLATTLILEGPFGCATMKEQQQIIVNECKNKIDSCNVNINEASECLEELKKGEFYGIKLEDPKNLKYYIQKINNECLKDEIEECKALLDSCKPRDKKIDSKEEIEKIEKMNAKIFKCLELIEFPYIWYNEKIDKQLEKKGFKPTYSYERDYFMRKFLGYYVEDGLMDEKIKYYEEKSRKCYYDGLWRDKLQLQGSQQKSSQFGTSGPEPGGCGLFTTQCGQMQYDYLQHYMRNIYQLGR